MKTRNSKNLFYAGEKLSPRLYPLVYHPAEILKECLKDLTKCDTKFGHLELPKWKRTDTAAITRLIRAKENGTLILPTDKYFKPKNHRQIRGPKPRTLQAKIPIKRVRTPPLANAQNIDENSPPEQMKPRTHTPPMETSLIEPGSSVSTPMVLDLAQNQTMSTEKFKPIESPTTSNDSPTEFL